MDLSPRVAALESEVAELRARLDGADLEQLMTTADVAKMSRLAVGTLEKFRLRGGGPDFVRIGASVRYRRADVLAWIRDRPTVSVGEENGQ